MCDHQTTVITHISIHASLCQSNVYTLTTVFQLVRCLHLYFLFHNCCILRPFQILAYMLYWHFWKCSTNIHWCRDHLMLFSVIPSAPWQFPLCPSICTVPCVKMCLSLLVCKKRRHNFHFLKKKESIYKNHMKNICRWTSDVCLLCVLGLWPHKQISCITLTCIVCDSLVSYIIYSVYEKCYPTKYKTYRTMYEICIKMTTIKTKYTNIVYMVLLQNF